MAQTRETLDVGLDQTKRLLDGQFAALNSIQTKIGVLLGFDVTTLGLIFSLGGGWIVGHRAVAAVATGALIALLMVFAYSLALRAYATVPDLEWLKSSLNDPSVGVLTLESELIGFYGAAFLQNKKAFSRKFYLVNVAIGLMVLGVAVYAVGGLLA